MGRSSPPSPGYSVIVRCGTRIIHHEPGCSKKAATKCERGPTSCRRQSPTSDTTTARDNPRDATAAAVLALAISPSREYPHPLRNLDRKTCRLTLCSVTSKGAVLNHPG